MSDLQRRCEARARTLDAALRQFVAAVRTMSGVHAIYVFGSFAEGNVGPYSDLDLLVVRETALTGPERGADLVIEAKLDIPCDLVVVTPSEYRDRLPNTSFGRTILASARMAHAA